jgi:hypothetical protein
MRVILWEIVTLLAVPAAVSKLLDLWLQPVEKTRLRRHFNDLSSALKQSDALVVIKSPLEMASIILDRIYGRRLLSWKAFRRATVLSIALMLFSLTVSGIVSGVPFGIHEPPWSTFNQTFDAIEQVAKEQAKKKTDKPEMDEMLRRGYAKALEFRTLRAQTIYSVAFFALVIASAVLSNFICVALARKTLRDMAHATTLFTLFSLSLINFLFSFFLYAACISIICTASLPFLWIVPPLLILCAVYVSWLLAVSITFPLVVAALKFSPQWMEIVSVVATLPGILVLLASLIALIAFPFRRVIRRLILEWLSRAAASDKGVLAFCAATFTLLGILVSLIPKLLFGSLGLS